MSRLFAAVVTTMLAASSALGPITAFSSSLQMTLPNNNRVGNCGAESSLVVNRRSFFANTVTAVSSVSFLLGGRQPAVAASSLPDIGAKAPSFSLPNSGGEGMTSLDSLTDSKKWTVLYFYPGAFTSGCTLEARNFQRDYDAYRALDAQIVGVSVDSVEKIAQFCTKEKLDFYLLSDVGGKVSKLYGSALSIPGFGSFSNRQTYIIDPEGKLRWTFKDVESRISKHSAEVLDKLKELKSASA